MIENSAPYQTGDLGITKIGREVRDTELPRIGRYLSLLVSTGRVAGRHPSHLPKGVSARLFFDVAQNEKPGLAGRFAIII
jgi:hypothetical protein